MGFCPRAKGYLYHMVQPVDKYSGTYCRTAAAVRQPVLALYYGMSNEGGSPGGDTSHTTSESDQDLGLHRECIPGYWNFQPHYYDLCRDT